MTSKSDRTEKPTPRRKRQARRKGQVAKSQEVAIAASLVTALIVLRGFGPSATRAIVSDTRTLIGHAGLGMDGETIRSLALDMLLRGVVPFLLAASILGTAAAVAQVGFILAPEAAKPKISNLSWKKGAQRLKPSIALWELARTGLKLGLLIAVIWEPLTQRIPELAASRSLDRILTETGSLVWVIFLRAGLLAVVIAVTDYAIARARTHKDLKMTKQEVKQEFKDQEGDPIFKSQRRRKAVEMSRNRLINVATADVLVTNPTHFAVALKYEPPEPAPRVVAKGTDRKAKKMRREARAHGVPVIEQRPLARALYRRAKVGLFVPIDLYEATAVVLATAYRRRRRAA